jgi:hypothetical protein
MGMGGMYRNLNLDDEAGLNFFGSIVSPGLQDYARPGEVSNFGISNSPAPTSGPYLNNQLSPSRELGLLSSIFDQPYGTDSFGGNAAPQVFPPYGLNTFGGLPLLEASTPPTSPFLENNPYAGTSQHHYVGAVLHSTQAHLGGQSHLNKSMRPRHLTVSTSPSIRPITQSKPLFEERMRLLNT